MKYEVIYDNIPRPIGCVSARVIPPRIGPRARLSFQSSPASLCCQQNSICTSSVTVNGTDPVLSYNVLFIMLLTDIISHVELLLYVVFIVPHVTGLINIYHDLLPDVWAFPPKR